VLIALRHLDPAKANDPYRRYLQDLTVRSHPELTHGAIAGAVARAIKDYARSEVVDAATVAALTETGIDGALSHLDALMQFEDTKMQRALAFFLSAVPLYWEHPEISPKFQALLDSDR